MFDKPKLDAFFAELKSKYGDDPDWDDIIREGHLGIAKSDGGVSLDNIDKRVIDLIEKHK